MAQFIIYFVNKLCLTILFARKKSTLLSLNLFFNSHYLCQKVSLYSRRIDFIIRLPLCDGYNAIFTCIKWLTKYCKLVPCFVREGALSPSSVAKLFFENIVTFFHIPGRVISNMGPRFTASFW